MKPLMGAVLAVCVAVPSFADFQYTEKSKVTGGAAVGAMKFAGVFSKDAKQMTQGMNSTVSVKGNKMRRESELGDAEIYDLDARRVIHIDTRHKTYSVMTFDEMRAQIEEQQRKAAQQQTKSKNDSQVKITPKVQITPGTASKQLLGQTAKETKMRIDMEVQSTDPKQQAKNGSFWVASDSWIAPVKGYEEFRRFSVQLAKELNWMPGAVFGGNAQIAPAMAEFNKNASSLNGLPLLQYVSVGATGEAQAETARSDTPSSPGGAIAKGIGGLFGRKKKKEDEAAQADSGKPANSASLMDMTSEVTSVSNSTLDAALFDIPAGYKKVDARNNGR